MNKIVTACFIFIVVTLLVVSCATPAAVPASPQQVATTTPKASTSASTSTTAPATKTESPRDKWAKEFDAWEKETYEGAKTEGKVVWYVSHSAEIIDALQKAFAKKYPGLKMENQSLRGDQITARVITEQNSGQNVGDLVGTGVNSLRALAKDGRNADFMPSAAQEPGVQWVMDPLGERENFPGSKGVPVFTVLIPSGFLINTKLVPPDKVPKSWKDLLDPWWKGKIIAQDPRMSGAGQNIWYYMREMYGEKFWTDLIAQNLFFDPSMETLGRGVATGEYYLALPGSTRELFNLKDAPLKLIYPSEGVFFIDNSVSMVKGAPHPNTAKLFLNWLLAKEAQDIFGQTSGLSPIRLGSKVALPEQDMQGRKVLKMLTYKASVEELPKLADALKKYIVK